MVVLWLVEEAASLRALVIKVSPPLFQEVVKGVKEDSSEERLVRLQVN